MTTQRPGRQPERSNGAFATFGLSKNVLRAIEETGFDEPRPIQAKAIPEALKGRDVLGLAQTGTGKTAAFAIPIIERFSANKGHNPRALILAPTRELAIQIHAEISLLAKYTNVRSTTVFGGVRPAPQIRALRAKPDIVVACPGRLLDLMGSGDVSLKGIEVLVLDEADHMFDMGFLRDIKRILAQLPERRQNLLFSATMPREIRGLADRVLYRPHVVELNHSAPAETIEHALYPVEQKRKAALLHHLISADDFRSAIVFLRTKHRARRLAQDLEKAGHRAIALQGNMSQSQRVRAMQGFRNGDYDVLVATDIAARGIDVAQVSHVVNFDVPDTPDAYTHRIGRTGRAERSGKAYTFVTSEDFASVRAIERKIKMEIPRIKLRDFRESANTAEFEESTKRGRGPRGNSGRRQGGGRSASGNNRGGQARNGRGSRPATAQAGRPARAGQAAQAPKTFSSSKPAADSPGFGAGLDDGASRSQSSQPKTGKRDLSKSGRRRQRMRTQSENKGPAKSSGRGPSGGNRGGSRPSSGSGSRSGRRVGV